MFLSFETKNFKIQFIQAQIITLDKIPGPDNQMTLIQHRLQGQLKDHSKRSHNLYRSDIEN